MSLIDRLRQLEDRVNQLSEIVQEERQRVKYLETLLGSDVTQQEEIEDEDDDDDEPVSSEEEEPGYVIVCLDEMNPEDDTCWFWTSKQMKSKGKPCGPWTTFKDNAHRFDTVKQAEAVMRETKPRHLDKPTVMRVRPAASFS